MDRVGMERCVNGRGMNVSWEGRMAFGTPATNRGNKEELRGGSVEGEC